MKDGDVMSEEKKKYSVRLEDTISPNNILPISSENLTPHRALEYSRRKRAVIKEHYSEGNLQFAKQYGLTPIHSSGYSHYMIFELDSSQLYEIRRDRRVVSTSEYKEVKLVNHQNDIISRQIRADNIRGSHAASFPAYLGNGVRIGVISAQNLTYIPSAAQLRGLEEEGRLIYLDGSVASQPAVHSTVVTSIILGKSVTVEGVEYRGVAPQSTVYFVPGFTQTDVYEAIEECLDNGAVIINYSAGEAFPDGEYSDFDRQIDTLIYNVGFCFVTSAGNSRFISGPGTACNCITVGNAQTKASALQALQPPYPMFFRSEDDCSAYVQSDYLPNKPDIAAPGTYVHYTNAIGEVEFNLYGTSFATPYVTGTAAQIVEKYPQASFSPMLVKALLLAGADSSLISTADNPVVSEFDPLRIKSGAGFLDSASSLGNINFESGVIKINDISTHSGDLQFEAAQGQRMRMILCYMKTPQDILKRENGVNVILELYTSDNTRVLFSDSWRENVKLMEYTFERAGIYHLRYNLTKYDTQSRDIPYAVCLRTV